MKDISAIKPEERLCAELIGRELLRTHKSVSCAPGPNPPDFDFSVDHEPWGFEIAGLVPLRSVGGENLPERAYEIRSLKIADELQSLCSAACKGSYELLPEGSLSAAEYKRVLTAGRAFVESGAEGPVGLLPRGRVTISRTSSQGELLIHSLPTHVCEDIRRDQRVTIAAELDDKLPKLARIRSNYDKCGICFWTDASWHREQPLRDALGRYSKPLTAVDLIFVAVSVGWDDKHLIQIYP